MNYQLIADAWLRDDRSVLDKLSAAERRAVGLIASGAGGDAELTPAGEEFVRGVKATTLGRMAGCTVGPMLKADMPENTIRWVYSDETVDRAGDLIRQSWELGNYKSNPIILWGHAQGLDSQADIPIGRSVRIGVENKQLVGDIEFAVSEYDRAAQIYRLAKNGFVKAGSVGFRPLKTTNVDDPNEREKLGLGRWGVIFERSELLEFSLCAIPCNPNALQESVKSGALRSEDADLAAALSDPTERDMATWTRRRARSWVAMSGQGAAGKPASGDSDGGSGGARSFTATSGTGWAASNDGGWTLLRVVGSGTDESIAKALSEVAASQLEDAASHRAIAASLSEIARGLTALQSSLGVPRVVDTARPGTDAKGLQDALTKAIKEALK